MFRAAHKQWEVAILILINTSASIKFRIVKMNNWLNLNKRPCWDSIRDPFASKQTHEPLDYATSMFISLQQDVRLRCGLNQNLAFFIGHMVYQKIKIDYCRHVTHSPWSCHFFTLTGTIKPSHKSMLLSSTFISRKHCNFAFLRSVNSCK